MHAYATEASDRRVVPVYLAVAAIALALALATALARLDLSVPWWLDAPAVIGFYGLLYRFFDAAAWRWRLGPVRLSRIPVVAGTWRGEVTSAHDPTVAHTAELRIRQTWTSIQIEFIGERSRSCSTMATLNPPGSTGPGLAYEYLSEPRGLAPESMAIHRGVALLRLAANAELVGDYYTGRGRLTHGTMRFSRATEASTATDSSVPGRGRPSPVAEPAK